MASKNKPEPPAEDLKDLLRELRTVISKVRSSAWRRQMIARINAALGEPADKT